MAHTPIETASLGATKVLLHPRGGFVSAIHVINTTTAGFVQVFDAASTASVTLGTTIPRYSLQVAANGVAEGLVGAQATFIDGIVVACTTLVAGTITAGPAHVKVWVE